MKAGIIAAGHGSRFFQAGWKQPKPLIPINGRPLIDYTIQNLLKGGIDEIGILLNAEPRTDMVEDHLRNSEYAPKVTVWRKTTRSSFESFSFVYHQIGNPPFVISTVDTIYDPLELAQLLDLNQYISSCELVLAVTEFVHDHRPLWALMKGDGCIQKLGDEVSEKRYVTAGLYLILQALPEPGRAERRLSALRDYLQYIVDAHGCVLGKGLHVVIDVDSPEDVKLAENFIKNKKFD